MVAHPVTHPVSEFKPTISEECRDTNVESKYSNTGLRKSFAVLWNTCLVFDPVGLGFLFRSGDNKVEAAGRPIGLISYTSGDTALDISCIGLCLTPWSGGESGIRSVAATGCGLVVAPHTATVVRIRVTKPHNDKAWPTIARPSSPTQNAWIQTTSFGRLRLTPERTHPARPSPPIPPSPHNILVPLVYPTPLATDPHHRVPNPPIHLPQLCHSSNRHL